MALRLRNPKKMTSSDYPTEPRILVADASVVINLNATGRSAEIIAAYPGSMVVTKNAFDELKWGMRKGHRDSDHLQRLVDDKVVGIATMKESGTEIYASLLEGAAVMTLDDGEAATIAVACELGAVAVIDERKARSICEKEFTKLVVLSTCEILAHPSIEVALGTQGQIEALVRALKDARMRVPSHLVKSVVRLIGQEQAASCNSLPKVAREGGHG